MMINMLKSHQRKTKNMINKILKSIFLSSAFLGLFLVMAPQSLAVGFAEHEITLDRVGNSLISSVILEREAFNTVVVELEKEIDGLEVDFGRGWEDVEVP